VTLRPLDLIHERDSLIRRPNSMIVRLDHFIKRDSSVTNDRKETYDELDDIERERERERERVRERERERCRPIGI
jgi:DNA repair ATPase RecN